MIDRACNLLIHIRANAGIIGFECGEFAFGCEYEFNSQMETHPSVSQRPQKLCECEICGCDCAKLLTLVISPRM